MKRFEKICGGQIPILISAVSSSLAQHRSGKLRIFAVFSEKRSKAAPDIPTALEVGPPGMFAYTINVIRPSAGTPRPVIDQLYKAVMTRRLGTGSELGACCSLGAGNVAPACGDASFARSPRARFDYPPT